MLIPLMLALAAQGAEAPAPSPGFQFRRPSVAEQRRSWFTPAEKGFGSQAPVETPAPLTCTITVLKADPKYDSKIARPAPADIDPKMVRPSPCRK